MAPKTRSQVNQVINTEGDVTLSRLILSLPVELRKRIFDNLDRPTLVHVMACSRNHFELVGPLTYRTLFLNSTNFGGICMGVARYGTTKLTAIRRNLVSQLKIDLLSHVRSVVCDDFETAQEFLNLVNICRYRTNTEHLFSEMQHIGMTGGWLSRDEIPRPCHYKTGVYIPPRSRDGNSSVVVLADADMPLEIITELIAATSVDKFCLHFAYQDGMTDSYILRTESMREADLMAIARDFPRVSRLSLSNIKSLPLRPANCSDVSFELHSSVSSSSLAHILISEYLDILRKRPQGLSQDRVSFYNVNLTDQQQHDLLAIFGPDKVDITKAGEQIRFYGPGEGMACTCPQE